MSELIQKNDNRATIRWKLLTGASALALSAYMASVTVALAEDASQPEVWIELGGQWEAQTGLGHTYAPTFMTQYPDSLAFKPVSPLHYEKPVLYALGEDGKITFQPDDSNWLFSASIRYGRSSSRRRVNQTNPDVHNVHYTRPAHHHYDYYLSQYVYTLPPPMGTIKDDESKFAQTQARQKQTHEIIDFAAGKDVGLGLFGKSGMSTLSAGVRFAQFRSSTSATIYARPTAGVFYRTNHFMHNMFPQYAFQFPYSFFRTAMATLEAQREFRGVGPSISWNASLPIAGNPSDETLSIDWGINAAMLFGKQRSRGQHQTSGHYRRSGHNLDYYTTGKPFDRSKRVTVPNVGGMLGMSLKFSDFKMSLGYRADFFFGAMDTGVDTRRTSTTGFYGPFASVSFGLGD